MIAVAERIAREEMQKKMMKNALIRDV